MPGKQQKSASKGWVRCDVKLNGKTVVITGANQGVGYETALDVAGRGARVIMACRRTDAGEEAKSNILKQLPDADVSVRKLDLASFASIREFARGINESESRLDVLVNNAGIMGCPQWKTEDGFEMQMGTNHIGHFLLTELLLELIKKSAPSRIVIVSSMAHKTGKMNWKDMMHEKNYSPMDVYAQTKLANIYHCLELSRKLAGTGVTCYSLHPGLVLTSLADHAKRGEGYSCCLRCCGACLLPCLERTVYISPKEGAQTSIYCAIAPELHEVSGKYYSKCAEERLSRQASDMQAAKRLWEMTEEWIRQKS
ncbi:unnamed protein product [Clavelina lepadiformis]|uniref:Uncharacterized protein n=1 Tax=Clavelina lepadiformis TaxID=159417 RepID=A0ABP0FZD0_CLALP